VSTRTILSDAAFVARVNALCVSLDATRGGKGAYQRLAAAIRADLHSADVRGLATRLVGTALAASIHPRATSATDAMLTEATALAQMVADAGRVTT
jgi:hypothetical protein